MEWSKNTITKAELEKKQREFMEQAMRMAKRSVTDNAEEKVLSFSGTELTEEKATIPDIKEEESVSEEIVHNTADELAEISEEAEDKEEENFFGETAEPVPEENTVYEGESYGVFDKDELTSAIERGEITGEGLRQAAEILAEMTNKTELMKKLLEEQEEQQKTAENGADYGLNSFIDRHNNNCRGCEDGKDSAS